MRCVQIALLVCNVLLSLAIPADALAQGAGQVVGGGGGSPFEERVPPGHFLVGFRITLGEYGPNPIVKSLQPIYAAADGTRTSEKRTFGDPGRPELIVAAPTGYAVGGLRIKGGDRVDGFSVLYFRIAGNQLNQRDRKESRWYGGRGGNDAVTLGGDGSAVVAVRGRCGIDLDALGLLMAADPQHRLEAPPRIEPARVGTGIAGVRNQPANFNMQNGVCESGTLLQADERTVTCLVKGRPYTYIHSAFRSIETRDAFYFFHTDKGQFLSDTRYEAEPDKTYEINLQGTVRLREPLAYYEVRGLIRRLNPDQSLVLELPQPGVPEGKTVTLPAGSVNHIFLGHEIEYFDRRPHDNEIPIGFTSHHLYWGPWLNTGKQLRVYPPRFVGSYRKISGRLGDFANVSTGGSVPVAEVVAEWKRKGDKESLKINYTWTPAWGEEKNRLGQAGLVGRVVNAWKTLGPEQRDMLKALAGSGLDIVARINDAARDQGLDVPPPSKPGGGTTVVKGPADKSPPGTGNPTPKEFTVSGQIPGFPRGTVGHFHRSLTPGGGLLSSDFLIGDGGRFEIPLREPAVLSIIVRGRSYLDSRGYISGQRRITATIDLGVLRPAP